MNHFKLVDPRSVPWFVYQFVNSLNWTFPYPPPVQDRKFFEKLAKMVISKPQNWNHRSQIQIHNSFTFREIFWDHNPFSSSHVDVGRGEKNPYLTTKVNNPPFPKKSAEILPSLFSKEISWNLSSLFSKEISWNLTSFILTNCKTWPSLRLMSSTLGRLVLAWGATTASFWFSSWSRIRVETKIFVFAFSRK